MARLSFFNKQGECFRLNNLRAYIKKLRTVTDPSPIWKNGVLAGYELTGADIEIDLIREALPFYGAQEVWLEANDLDSVIVPVNRVSHCCGTAMFELNGEDVCDQCRCRCRRR